MNSVIRFQNFGAILAVIKNKKPMKNLKLLLILVISFTLFSCTKATRLNNKLDGKWNVITYSGAALPTGTAMTITYSSGTKGSGNYTSTVIINGDTQSEFGAYQLDGNTKITYTPSLQGNVPYSFTIDKQTKDKLILINGNGVTTELRKID